MKKILPALAVRLFRGTALAATIVCLACAPGKGPDDPLKPADSKHGLTVSGEGVLLLEGKPFRGVGVNYFNAFLRTLTPDGTTDTSYRSGFRYLKERNIPFIRFSAGGYWPSDWNMYRHNKTRYFENFDSFVKAAEETGIGLIPSLFWHYATVPDLVNEPVGQWGNPSGKTHAFMKEYVREVVTRYRGSPAIWGWEFGNEYNLEADLPGEDHLPPVVVALGTPPARSRADKLTGEAIKAAFSAFAAEVRQYDASRIVISGNAACRPSSWHLKHQQSWEKDSKEQYFAMLDDQNPDPLSVYSMHHYPELENQYFQDRNVSLSGLVEATMKHSLERKKPLFIGEFGAQEAQYGVSGARGKYFEILEAIEAYEVPLAAVWVFDYPPHDADPGINISPSNGPREYMLEAIQSLNTRLQKQSE